MSNADELKRVVKSIPKGKVASYGDVGAAMNPPMSGRVVGMLLFNSPMNLPWWRVVNRELRLSIGKRGPHYAAEQTKMLMEEGVEFAEPDRVHERFRYIP